MSPFASSFINLAISCGFLASVYAAIHLFSNVVLFRFFSVIKGELIDLVHSPIMPPSKKDIFGRKSKIGKSKQTLVSISYSYTLLNQTYQRKYRIVVSSEYDKYDQLVTVPLMVNHIKLFPGISKPQLNIRISEVRNNVVMFYIGSVILFLSMLTLYLSTKVN